MNSGTFQGMMPAQTPTGALRIVTGLSAPCRWVTQSWFLAMST